MLQRSEDCLQYFEHTSVIVQQFVEQHFDLANRILEVAQDLVYEGHWEYGVSSIYQSR